MIERRELAQGLYFTSIDGNYKKSRLSAALLTPLRRETVTETALLPYMLERGTVTCPDMTLLKRRLNALYGTMIDTGYDSFGYTRINECVLQGADGSLLADGEKITEERAALLLDVLLHPCLEDGLFREDWLDIEREQLRDTIESIVNDKANYCFKLLNEEFCRGDLRALPTDGFAEDLDAIDARRLTAAYRETLDAARAEIFYVGPAPKEAFAVLRQAAQARSWKAADFRRPPAIARRSAPVDIVREMDVEQDKLAFAYASGELLDRRQLCALRLGCALFGGTPTSRLFQNVREKQSLCYSISATPSYESGGGMFVECGIEGKNAERTRAAIAAELAAFLQDGPSAQELEQGKLLFRNILTGVSDSSASIAKFVFTSLVRYNEIAQPQQDVEMLESISREEILDVMRRLQLSCSCRLTGKAGD